MGTGEARLREKLGGDSTTHEVLQEPDVDGASKRETSAREEGQAGVGITVLLGECFTPFSGGERGGNGHRKNWLFFGAGEVGGKEEGHQKPS